jgi:hypothetical protein
MHRVSFDDQSNKLLLNTIYESKVPFRNLSCEPISKIFALKKNINKKRFLFGNAGGIRTSVDENKKILAILVYSDENQREWPDTIEENILTYYGDSRSSNVDVGINTRGNTAFYKMFTAKHTDRRTEVPPVFVFFKEHNKPGINVEFKGLAVPGYIPKKDKKEELSLDQNSDDGAPNFVARFTILDEIKEIDRLWFTDIALGKRLQSNYCPKPWRTWINGNI